MKRKSMTEKWKKRERETDQYKEDGTGHEKQRNTGQHIERWWRDRNRISERKCQKPDLKGRFRGTDRDGWRSDKRDRARDRASTGIGSPSRRVGSQAGWPFHCLPKMNWLLMPLGDFCVSLSPSPYHLWEKWAADAGGCGLRNETNPAGEKGILGCSGSRPGQGSVGEGGF